MQFELPICPITQTSITDPVSGPDGHTYEREAIERWLEKNPVSPMDRSIRMEKKDLVPNYALKKMMEQYHATPAPRSFSSRDPPQTPEIFYSHSHGKTLVKIVPPDHGERRPRDIVVVIDISGSMDSNVTIKSASGETENHGMNILDIVKHAVVTIIEGMSPDDRLGIVEYDDHANTTLNFTRMDSHGKKLAKTQVRSMRPRGSTNLYGGILKGLKMFPDASARDGSVLLFTDGIPNIHPPKGEIATFQKYKQSKPNSPSIHMFGFGENLMSNLLLDLSIIGQGMFCYIPDASFVGTIFVNAVANIFSTFGNNATIITDRKNVDVGLLQFGETRTVELDYETAVSVKYDVCGKVVEIPGNFIAHYVQTPSRDPHTILVTALRNIIGFCDRKRLSDAVDCLNAAAQYMRENSGKEEYLTDGYIKDLEGQVREACSKHYYPKWGRHYLRSLYRSHDLQYCVNFKDPGVQNYGGSLFQTIREEMDDIFNNIEAPKSSRVEMATSSPVYSMNTYNDSDRPCFDGSNYCWTIEGATLLRDIKKGDFVLCEDRTFARIVCVVKTITAGGKANLCSVPSSSEFKTPLVVTPNHPIKYGGEWRFPRDLTSPAVTENDAVYSFVLNKNHRMMINTFPCITLGHGLRDGILEHAYYGTNKVVDDLRQMPGWDSGIIVLNTGCVEIGPDGYAERLVYNGDSIRV